MTDEQQCDWRQVQAVTAVFLACGEGMTRDDVLPAGLVTRAAHIAFLEMADRLVGQVGLVEWLRNSADTIEAQLLSAEVIQ